MDEENKGASYLKVDLKIAIPIMFYVFSSIWWAATLSSQVENLTNALDKISQSRYTSEMATVDKTIMSARVKALEVQVEYLHGAARDNIKNHKGE